MAACAALRAQAVPSWEDLQARGAVIAEIELRVVDVFDQGRPEENHDLGRFANGLHATTRPEVIRRELLFREGDPVDPRRIRESERLLRSFRFLKDASIRPELLADGRVRAVVSTQDAWTLKASVGWSRVGGQNTFGFSLREANLFGFGKDLVLERQENPDRNSTALGYRDRQLFGSDWNLAAAYTSLSDGRSRYLAAGRPYRALDTPWSAAIGLADSAQTVTVYDRQQAVYSIPTQARGAQAWFGASLGVQGDTVQRLGLGYQYQQTGFGPVSTALPGALPAPHAATHRLGGLYLSWNLFQERFRTFRDLAGMTHSEDYNLGWDIGAAAGLHAPAFGGDRISPYVSASLAKGWLPDGPGLVLLRGQAALRREGDHYEDGLATGSLTWYRPTAGLQSFAAYLEATASHQVGPADLLSLGGYEGLRGYPNHLWAGDRRWILSLEDRLLTQTSLWGILRLGFVAFADAGAIRRLDDGAWSRTYVDLGGGLRFGDLKSSLGRVLYLTLGYPMVREAGVRNLQVVFGNAVRF